LCSVWLEVPKTQKKQKRGQASNQGSIQKGQKSQSEPGHVTPKATTLNYSISLTQQITKLSSTSKTKLFTRN